MLKRFLRYLWAAPTTLLGLPLVALAFLTGGRVRRVRGALEAEGGALTWLLRHATPFAGGALALTLGHVILGQSASTLRRTRRHEHVHVRQAERWGPFFVPAYLLASLLAHLRGGHFYHDNSFEREAFASDRERADDADLDQ